MSAAQRVQQHPAFQQASDRANYYVNQLDKEVSPLVCYIFCQRLMTRFAVEQVSYSEHVRAAHPGAESLRGPWISRSSVSSSAYQRRRRTSLQPRWLGVTCLSLVQGDREPRRPR